jgi:hypothetical protein
MTFGSHHEDVTTSSEDIVVSSSTVQDYVEGRDDVEGHVSEVRVIESHIGKVFS